MLPLRLATQSYAWGVPAAQHSKVLDLARANGVDGTSGPEPDEMFAELWVGTHPSAASVIPAKTAAAAAQGTLSLEAWLEHHPEALGRVLAEKRAVGQPTGRLPFLMKVLSINKALPLQAHPTIDQAGALHQAHPDMYPDAAHKPEMVISLSGFCGFAGFLTPTNMTQLLQDFPQLTEVLGANNVLQYLESAQSEDDTKRQLALAAMWDHVLLRTPQHIAASVCNAVMTLMQDKARAPHHPPGHAPPPSAQPTGTTSSSAHHAGSMEAQQAATAAALSGSGNTAKACDLALALSVLGSKPGGLSQRLAMLSAACAAWPDDPVGVLGLMLLDDVVLGPGAAVVIPAGCPHAYICGEVLEVQAASNNAIKGGLTAPGESTDKQGLVAASTAHLLQATGQASTPAMQAGLSISVTDAAANLPKSIPGSSSSDSDSSSKMHEGPPRQIEPQGLGHPRVTPSGGAAAQVLRLYRPDVDEFQVLHCAVPGGHKAELVVDPGPGVLLVVGGSGRAMVRASAVSGVLMMDEVGLQPGTALFLAAGSSISISGISTSAPLDAWITTANNRLFSAAATAPAGEAEAMRGLSLSSTGTTPDVAGKAGAVLAGGAVDPAATFTAAEQVAAGIMMGGADSSAPANAAQAAVTAQGQQPSDMQIG